MYKLGKKQEKVESSPHEYKSSRLVPLLKIGNSNGIGKLRASEPTWNNQSYAPGHI